MTFISWLNDAKRDLNQLTRQYSSSNQILDVDFPKALFDKDKQEQINGNGQKRKKKKKVCQEEHLCTEKL